MNDDSDFEEFAPWLVLLITLVGGFLRVLLLGAKGMWLDETFSVWLANQTLGEMMQSIVRIDQHPPLYYLLLHGWVAFVGDTAYYARLLSALIGTATIPVLYLIGKRIAEKAKAAGIEKVAFDRSGFAYHGRVKALADAAREAGLQF